MNNLVVSVRLKPWVAPAVATMCWFAVRGLVPQSVFNRWVSFVARHGTEIV